MTLTSTARPAPRVQRLLAAVRDELHDRRDARAAHRRLAEELSTYTSRAEIDDLLATLERHDDATVEPMRAILIGNLHDGRPGWPLAS